MSDTEIQKIVDSAIKWANELSEIWTNTTAGRVIKYRKEHLESLANVDLNLANIAAQELIEACKQADKEF